MCSKNKLTLTVIGTHIFTYGNYIFLWEFITAFDMESFGIPWEVWLEVNLKLGPRDSDHRFPSTVIFSLLIICVAPGQVFINFRSSLAQFRQSPGADVNLKYFDIGQNKGLLNLYVYGIMIKYFPWSYLCSVIS